eukprot:scaffold245_cov256-Pinguiococcus_pyrenoidosus.AAC.27
MRALGFDEQRLQRLFLILRDEGVIYRLDQIALQLGKGALSPASLKIFGEHAADLARHRREHQAHERSELQLLICRL